MEDSQSSAPQNPTPKPCWSSLLKPTQNPQHQNPQQIQSQNPPLPPQVAAAVESCKSTKGIAVAVVDANAIIEGGERLTHLADKFVSVPEVLAEIRDPMSRHRLNFIPFSIDTMEPSPDALKKVIKFARATGDLQTLSDVDLKLLALTYTLEAQIHGTMHLKECPPPVQLVNVKRLPEKEMPGWGNNVSNLEEWEALEHEVPDEPNSNSRILPLKDLNLNVIPQDNQSENGTADNMSEAHTDNHDNNDGGLGRPHKRYPPQKREVKIEGKKMVAEGVDASQGQVDDGTAGGDEWRPAVSRSTHRRYLRRKARREYHDSLAEEDNQQNSEESTQKSVMEADKGVKQLHQIPEQGCPVGEASHEAQVEEGQNADGSLSSILRQMRIEEDSSGALQEEKVMDNSSASSAFAEADSDNHEKTVIGENGTDINETTEQLEISSQNNESVDISCADDDCSEQSWGLRSLSESSVACITGDFAMQNVLLQLGLRLLAPGGMQIRELHRWILKCHACSAVTTEIGRIFCPKCGNAGTLRKVAVTVNENGIVIAARRPRITLRGTKFSLPLPQGGRDGITKNLVLREDQLPQKFLYQKTRKKANKDEDDYFTTDDIFGNRTNKKSLRPPVRQALAVFSGKRNPNDNHFSRSKHK